MTTARRPASGEGKAPAGARPRRRAAARPARAAGAARKLRGGVDLGGTKISAVVVDAENAILGQARAETPREGGPAAVTEAIAAALREASEAAGTAPFKLAGVGVGSPGAIDAASGSVSEARNLPDWIEPFPLADELRSEARNEGADRQRRDGRHARRVRARRRTRPRVAARRVLGHRRRRRHHPRRPGLGGARRGRRVRPPGRAPSRRAVRLRQPRLRRGLRRPDVDGGMGGAAQARRQGDRRSSRSPTTAARSA